jgi:hypothetical protein
VRKYLTLAILFTAIAQVSVAQDRFVPPQDPLVIVKNGNYGYIDHDGKMVIKPQFIWANDFDMGHATVYICGRYATVDSKGTLLPYARPFSRNWLPKKVGDKFGFVDSTGKMRIEPAFEEALPFSEGLAAVQNGGLWGFIDTSGKMIIPARFEDAFYFREGVGYAHMAQEPVLIARTGKVLASGYSLSVGIPAEGRIPVDRDGKYGYLGLDGKIAIPLAYTCVNTFSHGLAPVENGQKWGYINREGRTVIPFKFDDAGRFASGLAPVRVGKDSGFIDRSGNFKFHLAFRQAPGFLTGDEDDMFLADYDISRFWTTDDKFGYVNTAGKVIWGPADGSPDHAPILGWDEQSKIKSCEGFSQEIREMVSKFPPPD